MPFDFKCTDCLLPCHQICVEVLRFPQWWLFRLRSSGLWHHVVLKTDTNILKKHATFICRVELYRFRNWCSYADRLQGIWSWDTREGVSKQAWSRSMGRKTRKIPLRVPFKRAVFPVHLFHWARSGSFPYPSFRSHDHLRCNLPELTHFNSEGGVGTCIWNISISLQVYLVSQSRRPQSGLWLFFT